MLGSLQLLHLPHQNYFLLNNVLFLSDFQTCNLLVNLGKKDPVIPTQYHGVSIQRIVLMNNGILCPGG